MEIHLGRTIVHLIKLDMFLPIQLQTVDREIEHFRDGMRFSGGMTQSSGVFACNIIYIEAMWMML